MRINKSLQKCDQVQYLNKKMLAGNNKGREAEKEAREDSNSKLKSSIDLKSKRLMKMPRMTPPLLLMKKIINQLLRDKTIDQKLSSQCTE